MQKPSATGFQGAEVVPNLGGSSDLVPPFVSHVHGHE